MKSIFKTSVQSEDGIGEIDVSKSFMSPTVGDGNELIVFYYEEPWMNKDNLQRFVYPSPEELEEDMSRLQSFRTLWNAIHAPKD